LDLIRIILPYCLRRGFFFKSALAGAFWLNMLLTLLGYIPGIVHAVMESSPAAEHPPSGHVLRNNCAQLFKSYSCPRGL